MTRLPPRLRALERRLFDLLDDEAMMVSTLDGYLAGILVCPDLVMPSEWLPHVWGGDGDAPPIFDSAEEAQAIVRDVMEHYNALARLFGGGTGSYKPILDDDERTGEILWEIWAEGFGRAVDLRPGSWLPITQGDDEEAKAALAGLLSLVAISNRESELPKARIDELTAEAPGLIPGWIAALNAWRLAHACAVPTPPMLHSGRVGRNDPCPCGSGKKFKKCCGLN